MGAIRKVGLGIAVVVVLTIGLGIASATYIRGTVNAETGTPTATPVIVCMEMRGLEECTLHPTPTPRIPTDVNADGRVNIIDIGLVVRDFGRVQ